MKECFRGVFPPVISTVCIVLLILMAISCSLRLGLFVTPPDFRRGQKTLNGAFICVAEKDLF